MSILWNLIRKRSQAHGKITKKVYSLPITIFANLKGSYVGSGADFKGDVTFPHGLNGILISGGASIGKNATIFHQVTIGSNTLEDSKGAGAPTIGDNCYIGAGAKIIGNVKIGDNVRIGANCVVVKDIPPNCSVVNQPARVIKKQNENNKFVGIRQISLKEKEATSQ